MDFIHVLRCATSRVPRAALLVMISVVLIMALVACGKKGPVRSKQTSLPSAPAEVTIRQQGNLFVLGWTIPTSNLDGSAAEELNGFMVRRLSYDANDGCPTCREPKVEVAEIDLKYPTPGQRIGDRIYWRDLDIRIANGYRYAIAPVTLGGQEGPPAMVHLAAQQPPPSPTGLQVEAGDSQVSLQWQAPPLTGETTLVGYNLYRRQAKGFYPIVPVNTEPLRQTALLDRGLDNGRAYEYRVSALVSINNNILESTASSPALITPQAGR